MSVLHTCNGNMREPIQSQEYLDQNFNKICQLNKYSVLTSVWSLTSTDRIFAWVGKTGPLTIGKKADWPCTYDVHQTTTSSHTIPSVSISPLDLVVPTRQTHKLLICNSTLLVCWSPNKQHTIQVIHTRSLYTNVAKTQLLSLTTQIRKQNLSLEGCSFINEPYL